MKRKQLLYTEERKWEYGTILIEDGICLIENGEGDILLADSLQHSPIWIHHKGKWEQAGFQDKLVLACGAENISLSGGERIRYEKSVKRPLMALLDSLDDETFLAFLQHLHSFGLSVFDCVFSYNKGVFSDTSAGHTADAWHFRASSPNRPRKFAQRTARPSHSTQPRKKMVGCASAVSVARSCCFPRYMR